MIPLDPRNFLAARMPNGLHIKISSLRHFSRPIFVVQFGKGKYILPLVGVDKEDVLVIRRNNGRGDLPEIGGDRMCKAMLERDLIEPPAAGKDRYATEAGRQAERVED